MIKDFLKKNRIPVVLGLVIALAVFLRFFHLNDESFWMDEYVTWYSMERLSFGQMIGRSLFVGHYPLYFILLRGYSFLVGSTDFSLRAFSAFWGVLAVWLTFLCGRKLFSAKTGLLSAFFVAISPIMIEYSQEARMYTLVSCLALISFLAFLRWRESAYRQGMFWFWLSAFFGLYSHAYFAFFFFALGVWALAESWRKPAFNKTLLVLSSLSLAYLPAFWTTVSGMIWPRQFFPVSTWDYMSLPLVVSLGLKSLLLRDSIAIYIEPSTAYSFYFNAIFCVFLIFSLVWGFRLRKGEGKKSILVFFVAAVSLAIPLVVSTFWKPVFSAHYLLYIVPFLWLSIAHGLMEFPYRKLALHGRTFIAILLLAVSLFSFFNLKDYYSKYHKAPWKQTAAYLWDRVADIDGVVMIDQLQEVYPVFAEYYLKGRFPVYVDGQVDYSSFPGDIWLIFIDGMELNKQWASNFNLLEEKELDGFRILRVSYKR